MPQIGHKKDYTTPTLTTYGDVRKITENSNNSGKHFDFAKFSAKTH